MHTYAHAHAHTYTLIHHYLCSLLDMGGQAGWCASRWAAYAHRRGGDGAAGVVILVRVCFVRRRGRRGPAARGCPGYRAARRQGGWTPLICASSNGHQSVVEALIGSKAAIESKNNVSLCAKASRVCRLTRRGGGGE